MNAIKFYLSWILISSIIGIAGAQVNTEAMRDDEKEGFKMLEAIARTSRRVFGRNHPQTVEALRDVERSRAIIDRRRPKLDLAELPGY